MVNKQIFPRYTRKELYKAYLKKIFAGASIKLSDLEIDILDAMKQNNYKWDSQKFTKSLNISIQHLNNYKSKLIKKGLIVKNDVQEYITNPVHGSWIYLSSNDKNETVYRLIIDLIVIEDQDVRQVQPDHSESSLEESISRERSTEDSTQLLQTAEA